HREGALSLHRGTARVSPHPVEDPPWTVPREDRPGVPRPPERHGREGAAPVLLDGGGGRVGRHGRQEGREDGPDPSVGRAVLARLLTASPSPVPSRNGLPRLGRSASLLRPASSNLFEAAVQPQRRSRAHIVAIVAVTSSATRFV
ncbi:hypothetical protein THAOC_31314, partial [Thalassiosira oceanica]